VAAKSPRACSACSPDLPSISLQQYHQADRCRSYPEIVALGAEGKCLPRVMLERVWKSIAEHKRCRAGSHKYQQMIASSVTYTGNAQLRGSVPVAGSKWHRVRPTRQHRPIALGISINVAAHQLALCGLRRRAECGQSTCTAAGISGPISLFQIEVNLDRTFEGCPQGGQC